MKKPVIGLTPSLDSDHYTMKTRLHYPKALEAAGGIPLLLPPLSPDTVREASLICDGLLFTGGVDVHPSYYGEEMLAACGEVCPQRDEMELSLLRLALERDLPVLGICRGIQLINVGLGGTLWQDLPSQTGSTLCHSQRPPYEMTVHTVHVEESSALFSMLGVREYAVNSTHHQAVRGCAPSLQAAARSCDGIIEAVWRPQSRFLLGVQWHPEFRFEQDKGAAALFSALVRACGT